MGLSEYLQMRKMEREAADIRSSLRENRHTPESAKGEMRANKDDWKKVKKGKKPTLTAAQVRKLESEAKKREKEIARLKREANKKK